MFEKLFNKIILVFNKIIIFMFNEIMLIFILFLLSKNHN